MAYHNGKGKQFSKDYQPPVKWTEERALKVGQDLIDWLNAEEENMFYEEFLLIVNDYDLNLPKYLAGKFSSFYELLEKAKKIQELKLKKYGVFDKLNPSMTKFVLINNHGWTDRSEVKADVNIPNEISSVEIIRVNNENKGS